MMTQEDKELLLKDLCARLPYGVKVQVEYDAEEFGKTIESDEVTMIDKYGEEILLYHSSEYFNIEELKPYLRPMSSMTEEERKYIEDKCAFTPMGPIGGNFCLVMPVIATEWLTDFYNSHYLDWRGLIEKGLAIEAPEGMYD